MNLINKGDFLEAYTKVKQRGLKYFFKKLNFNSKKRTQSTFNPLGADGSNWWIIPEVRQRENEKLTGDSQKTFDIYLSEIYFQEKTELKLLSVACGVGNREIKLAESKHFCEVLGIDLSRESIQEANRKVGEKGLSNIQFEQADFYSFDLKEEYYDVIVFYSALHHFKNIESVAARISKALKNDGIVVLCEYVGKNRLQFSKDQVAEMNKLLNIIPKQYKTRYLTGYIKKAVYAPGLLRMIVSDPSEAVESESIIPVIHSRFEVLEEKNIGGDLLMMVLKDIAHHFISEDAKAKSVLERLFEEEDKYLNGSANPDFIFGVYRKRVKH
jgi:2-polyprenyl-3-methyl-5-hydroxy-6-metoxy-1,4-benzoquinol methylase